MNKYVVILFLCFAFQIEVSCQCYKYYNKIINCTTNDGLKIGYWIYFINDDFTLNRIKEGNYFDNVKVGKWRYYGYGSDYSGEITVDYFKGYFVINADVTVRVKNDYSELVIYCGDFFNSYIKLNKCENSQFYNCILVDRRLKKVSNKTIHGMKNALGAYNFGYLWSDEFR